MARKGGSGGGRRSGGHKKSHAAKHGRQNMRRQMRKGMRQFNRMGAKGGNVTKNQKSSRKSSTLMNNFKVSAAMATTATAMSSRHHGVGQGGFGANEETQIEQEMAYMSVYDQMDNDPDEFLQHHLDLLSIEG